MYKVIAVFQLNEKKQREKSEKLRAERVANPYFYDAGSAEKVRWSSQFFSAVGIAEVRVRTAVQAWIFQAFLAAAPAALKIHSF